MGNDVKLVRGTLVQMMKDLDTDDSGFISRAELNELLVSCDAVQVLTELGVTPGALISFLQPFFEQTDEDGLSLVFIVEVLLELRGSNPVTVRRMLHLQNFLQWSMRNSWSHMEKQISGVVLERAQKLDSGLIETERRLN